MNEHQHQNLNNHNIANILDYVYYRPYLSQNWIFHNAQIPNLESLASTKLDYEIGDTVRHIKFGVGIVTDIVDGGRDYEVTVNFDQAGTKKMFASFAKLKKL